MALTPEQSNAIIREVDDAVRQDDMRSFWTRYGKLVAIAAVVALAAFGAWLLWQSRQHSQAEANSEQFAMMLKAAQATRLDQDNYDKLVTTGSAGYRTEAELVKAALASGRNDDKAAIATYDAVLADGDAPQPMKDLALIRRTALAFDTAKPDAVIAALKGLAVPGNAWFGSAGEMTAIAYLKMNKTREAGEMFASLSRELTVPDSIRLRAGQMASTLGVTPEAIGSLKTQEQTVAAQ